MQRVDADSVSGVIEPQGPLPPEIYWRRRIVAVGAAVAVVALVVGLIIWTSVGGDDKPQNTAAASSVPPPPTTPASASASAPAPSSGAVSGGGGGSAGGSTDPSAPGASGTAQASKPEQLAPAPASGEGSAICPDQNIAVVLYTDKSTYSGGDQPKFTLVTTNAGLTACSRDIGKASQNVVVRTLDGTRTLWSARDCSPINTVDNKLLQPQQQVKADITWSGTTSVPGCDKPRVQIPVGAYQAIGKIGEKESTPITFNVVAPARP